MCENDLGFRICFYEFLGKQYRWQIGDTLTMSKQFVEFSSSIWFAFAIKLCFDGFQPILVIESIVKDCLPAMVQLIDAKKLQSVGCCCFELVKNLRGHG